MVLIERILRQAHDLDDQLETSPKSNVILGGDVHCSPEVVLVSAGFFTLRTEVWFWSVFRRSKALWLLALLSTVMELPEHVCNLDQASLTAPLEQ